MWSRNQKTDKCAVYVIKDRFHCRTRLSRLYPSVIIIIIIIINFIIIIIIIDICWCCWNSRMLQFVITSTKQWLWYWQNEVDLKSLMLIFTETSNHTDLTLQETNESNECVSNADMTQ